MGVGSFDVIPDGRLPGWEFDKGDVKWRKQIGDFLVSVGPCDKLEKRVFEWSIGDQFLSHSDKFTDAIEAATTMANELTIFNKEDEYDDH